MVRAFEVAAARARLQRGALRPIVRATRPLLPLRCSTLGNGQTSSSSLAEPVLLGGQLLPPGVGGRLAPAGARVQVLATPRAEPAAVVAAQQESGGREHQLFTYHRRDVDERRVPRQGIGDRKSTRLNSSHPSISYAVFCLKKKKNSLTRNTANKKKKQNTIKK